MSRAGRGDPPGHRRRQRPAEVAPLRGGALPRRPPRGRQARDTGSRPLPGGGTRSGSAGLCGRRDEPQRRRAVLESPARVHRREPAGHEPLVRVDGGVEEEQRRPPDAPPSPATAWAAGVGDLVRRPGRMRWSRPSREMHVSARALLAGGRLGEEAGAEAERLATPLTASFTSAASSAARRPSCAARFSSSRPGGLGVDRRELDSQGVE